MRRWIFKGLLLLTVVAAFLGGIVALGHWSRGQIRQRERYLVPFTRIECTPPAGMDRGAFLKEVREADGPESRVADNISILDDDVRERLTAAFQRHPWVARVLAVEVVPPKQVRVTLAYRHPVLAVKIGNTLRAVDAEGVLLPDTAGTDGLPVYSGTPAPPKGRAGMPWGDVGVEKVARALGK